ncbi:hypothetical protein VNI00_003608 [Paramarasmius palmivorus]|uniref:Uncharacterized protein n=1 Tax=Paramarasmius palmivorus TaxID=297713 RepID=A0AAW0DSV5_9AGAR
MPTRKQMRSSTPDSDSYEDKIVVKKDRPKGTRSEHRQPDIFRATREKTKIGTEWSSLGEAINATLQNNFQPTVERDSDISSRTRSAIRSKIVDIQPHRQPSEKEIIEISETSDSGAPSQRGAVTRSKAANARMPSGKETVEILETSDTESDAKVSFIEGSAHCILSKTEAGKLDRERLTTMAEEIDKVSEEIRVAGEERAKRLDCLLSQLENRDISDKACVELLGQISRTLEGADVVSEKIRKLVPFVEIPVVRKRKAAK